MIKAATIVLTLLCCVPLASQAAPDAFAPAASAVQPGATGPAAQPGDAVLQMLRDKGLLPSTAGLAARMESSPLVQQMRDSASGLVVSAMNFIGVRYRRGGSSAETGFDCS